MREHKVGDRLCCDERSQCLHKTIGRVGAERIVFQRDDFSHVRLCQLSGSRSHRGARQDDLDRRAQLLRRGDGFPRGAVQDAVLLFCHHQNHQKTLASSRNARTSSAAASAGLPPIMRVCLDFSGMYTAVMR